MNDPSISPLSDTRVTEPGGLLRRWRALRGLSQHDLALEAQTTPRHLSFIESGRTRASAEMLLRLADVLAIPRRHRNALLEAGGYAPRFLETGLPEAPAAESDAALAALLRDHEPFPAFAMDHALHIRAENRAMQWSSRLFWDRARLWPGEARGEPCGGPEILLSPHGLRPSIDNWPQVANWLLALIYRAAWAGAGNPVLQARLAELLRIEGVAEVWREPAPDAVGAPCVDVRLRRWGLAMDTRTLYLTFGDVEDVYLRHTRVILIQAINPVAAKFLRWSGSRERTQAQAQDWKA